MKTKMLHRRIFATYSNNPGEVLRLITEADKIVLKPELYNYAADIVETVRGNVPDIHKNDTTGVYLLKIAYILNQEGKLIEAPPKPPRKKKAPEPKPEPEPPKDMSLKDIAKLAIKHSSVI